MHLRPNCEIYAFPPLPSREDRLTWRDRIALHETRDRLATSGYRYTTSREQPLEGPACDLVQLFQGAGRWSTWCMVRRDNGIHAWRGADGFDVGVFATMPEALNAVLSAPTYRSARYGTEAPLRVT